MMRDFVSMVVLGFVMGVFGFLGTLIDKPKRPTARAPTIKRRRVRVWFDV
jgi:hypothetical protein